MIESMKELHPVLQSLMGGTFTWVLTTVGAALVFLSKDWKPPQMDFMLGGAAGIMVAVSFWSLLLPSQRMSGIVVTAIGFLVGSAFLWVLDKLLPHLHPGNHLHEQEGPKKKWKRSTLLVLAITLHNIPEGLAIGAAFAAASLQTSSAGVATLAGAVALVIGIGIQDVPEGAAVTMPLHHNGMSRRKSFWYGSLSGLAEPIGAVLGAWAFTSMLVLMPYAMSFSAGAMVYVVVEELLPEAQKHHDTDRATIGFILGFVLMMVLDTMV